MGSLPSLECCTGEDTGSLGRAGLENKEGELPPLCERAAGVHGALPGGGRGAKGEFMR